MIKVMIKVKVKIMKYIIMKYIIVSGEVCQ